ncbi:hypothetical protein ACOJVU_11365 [Mycobacterium sp. THU-M104]|uniref:hypothetical protein n=1 Tax=Mycobacterium sp. THU-M104 TaxID=3410515 RepID=UPI003B9A596D
MLTTPVRISQTCVGWIGFGGWSAFFLICAVGYLSIVKAVLIRRLYAAAHRPAVRGVAAAKAAYSEPPAISESTVKVPGQVTDPGHESPENAANATAPPGLAALDWTSVGCQNSQGCTRVADYVVEYHAIDHCLDSESNALGNRVEILCKTCSALLHIALDMQIGRLISQGRDLRCRTCGKVLALPTDILRSGPLDLPADGLHAARPSSTGDRLPQMSMALPHEVSGW